MKTVLCFYYCGQIYLVSLDIFLIIFYDYKYKSNFIYFEGYSHQYRRKDGTYDYEINISEPIEFLGNKVRIGKNITKSNLNCNKNHISCPYRRNSWSLQSI